VVTLLLSLCITLFYQPTEQLEDEDEEKNLGSDDEMPEDSQDYCKGIMRIKSNS
jgi:hypothetical protein